MHIRTITLWLGVLSWAVPAVAQDNRADYPPWLAHAFVEFSVGNIGYPFSARQLEDGFTVESVHAPKLAARLVLGDRLSDRTSLRLTYLRPARWVAYRNVNGAGGSHSVWMNVIGASLRQRVPLSRGLSIYGEGGIAVVTRHGIEIDGVSVVDDVVYPTPLLGAGAEYRLNDAWGVQLESGILPGRSSRRQPHTSLVSMGVVYRVDPPARAVPADPAGDQPIFHEHLIQGGITSDAFGEGFNKIVAPLFWEGRVKVGAGFAVDYQRNVFHTASLFSLDWGASLAYRSSRERHDDFMTLSMYPLLRLTPIRTAVTDVYFNYSLAGPAFISKYRIDGIETGRHFTMRDAVGVGMYMGRGKHMNAEVRIAHYSNGNVFPRNSGIQVPMTLTFGYAF